MNDDQPRAATAEEMEEYAQSQLVTEFSDRVQAGTHVWVLHSYHGDDHERDDLMGVFNYLEAVKRVQADMPPATRAVLSVMEIFASADEFYMTLPASDSRRVAAQRKDRDYETYVALKKKFEGSR